MQRAESDVFPTLLTMESSEIEYNSVALMYCTKYKCRQYSILSRIRNTEYNSIASIGVMYNVLY